jgi:predicted ester cyclase
MATKQLPSPESTASYPRRVQYQSYIEFCNAHDFAAMEDFYTSPIKINDVPWSPSKVTAQFKPLIEGFPDWHWEIRHFGVDGDYLHLHFKVTGTHLGTFQGVEPTGRKVETTQFTLYHLVDGKYAEVWDLTDIGNVIEQIS